MCQEFYELSTSVILCCVKKFYSENFKTLIKGLEPVLCEASEFSWSFLKFYYVNMKRTIINY